MVSQAAQDERETLQQRVAELERERDKALLERQWMQDVLEKASIPICLWYGDTYLCTFANRAYLTELGKHDAIGKTISEVFAEEEIPGLIALLKQVYTSGKTSFIEEARVRLPNSDTGEVEDRWFNLIYNPIHNQQGEVVGVTNFAVDVPVAVRAR